MNDLFSLIVKHDALDFNGLSIQVLGRHLVLIERITHVGNAAILFHYQAVHVLRIVCHNQDLVPA